MKRKNKLFSFLSWRKPRSWSGAKVDPSGQEQSLARELPETPLIHNIIQARAPMSKAARQAKPLSPETRKLLARLRKEYEKQEVFRTERVANLKKLIKAGKYRVPGKDVVAKWFPEH